MLADAGEIAPHPGETARDDVGRMEARSIRPLDLGLIQQHFDLSPTVAKALSFADVRLSKKGSAVLEHAGRLTKSRWGLL